MTRNQRRANTTAIIIDSLRDKSITQARQEHPLAGAALGWDELTQQWWVACDDCQITRHYTASVDVASNTLARHNEQKHGGA